MQLFFETWKGIADAMSRSERWCRYMARRAMDPLPVYKLGGIVRMNAADRDAWIERQRGGAPAAGFTLGEIVTADTLLQAETARVESDAPPRSVDIVASYTLP